MNTNRTYLIAELGINHNGNLNTALRMIDAAADAGFDCCKIQKREISKVYTKEELASPRQSPFGKTVGDLKWALEFSPSQIEELVKHCEIRGVEFAASVWDTDSLAYINTFDVPFIKIPSAKLTDHKLLAAARYTGKPVILSTGMSTLDEIDEAVKILTYPVNHTDGKLVLLHCTSTYPTIESELNLRCIITLKERYGLPVGYSGHEKGLATTIAAVALGAGVIERHITLDRTAFGTDQAASVETAGFRRLVRDIRSVEQALGDGNKVLYDSELPIKAKLRR